MSRRWRRASLGVVLLLGALVAACADPGDSTIVAGHLVEPATVTVAEALPRHQSASPWNVLVVSFDALRADRLGIYGYRRATSPNIDRFARQAVVFDRAFSASPVTPTSFASAFTGQLPTQVFRGWGFQPVGHPSGPSTLAAAFTAAGYRTGALLNNTQLTTERGFDAGFDDYRFFDAIADEQLGARAARWLRMFGARPFFLWVHYLSPHSPYDYRDEAQAFYDPDYRGPFETTSTARFAPVEPRDVRRIGDLYDGEILHADRLFQDLLDVVTATGLRERTIIVLTADHGEEFGERGGFQHRHLYRETVRIPLMIRHPQAPGGMRSQALVSNVDLWPTLAALTGVAPPAAGPGHDLSAPIDADRSVVSVAMTDTRYRGVALRSGDESLIVNCVPDRSVRFYDVAVDPAEAIDRTSTHRPHVRTLIDALGGHLGGGDPCDLVEAALRGRPATEGLSAETIDGLRALGYL